MTGRDSERGFWNTVNILFLDPGASKIDVLSL